MNAPSTSSSSSSSHLISPISISSSSLPISNPSINLTSSSYTSSHVDTPFISSTSFIPGHTCTTHASTCTSYTYCPICLHLPLKYHIQQFKLLIPELQEFMKDNHVLEEKDERIIEEKQMEVTSEMDISK